MGIQFQNKGFLWAILLVLIFMFILYWRLHKRTWKNRISNGLRVCTVILLGLAMAQMGVVWKSRQTQMIVLVDRSESMRGMRARQEDMIQEIERTLPAGYSMSVIGFGADSLVESKFDERFGHFAADVQASQTDLEQALRFASAYFSPEYAKQVFIMTDGQENQGDVMRILSLLRARGIRVDGKALESGISDDAQISSVDVPRVIYQNEQFDVSVTIDSETAKEAILYLYEGQDVISEQSVMLEKGSNTFVFQDTASQTGMINYRAVLAETGGMIQNNEKSVVSKVMGPPNLLLIEGMAGDAQELGNMLRTSAMQTRIINTHQLPEAIADIQLYDALALVNVNADDLSAKQVGALDQYVRVLGKGLVVFGGDNSYALGGYIGSELEKILPVESNVRNKMNVPSMAMIMIVDKSGSMDGIQTGLSKMDLAKEAMARSVELFIPQDEIGILAFDDKTYWVSELQKAENIAEIQERIGSIRAGGGTVMGPSLQEALRALKTSDASIKHVILLTDGQPADRGFDQVVEEMAQEGITLSGVAVGADANSFLLEYLSDLGGGRFYQTNSFDSIPSIFAKETQLTTRSYVQNRIFYPEIVQNHELIASFHEGFPHMTGFLATIPKPMANVILQSDNGMPILAQWQYGAGTVIAWTSDVRGRWTEDFLIWEKGNAFFAGLMGGSLRQNHEQGYVSMEGQGKVGQIMLEIDGMDDAQTEAEIISPEGDTIQIPMTLEKPGQFIANIPLEEEGAYTALVRQSKEGRVVNQIESGVAVSYSDEYDTRRKEDRTILQDIVRYTDGRMIENSGDIFDRPMEPVKKQTDLSQSLLWVAFALFMIELVLRKLQWETKVQTWMDAGKQNRQLRQAKVPVASSDAFHTPPPQKGKKKVKPQEPKKDLGGELLKRRKQ